MPYISSPAISAPDSPSPEQGEDRKRPHPPEDKPAPTKKRLFGKSLFEPISQPRESEVPEAVIQNAPTISKAAPNKSLPQDLSTPRFDIPTQSAASTIAASSSSGLEGIHTSGFVLPSVDNSRQLSEVASCQTASGRRVFLSEKKVKPALSFERIVAERSSTRAGRATSSYYGIEIHKLIEDAKKINSAKAPEEPAPPAEVVAPSIEARAGKKRSRMMWSEKYRAKRFTDLVGDERTHRTVLRWLKAWDPIVFPGASKPMIQGKYEEEDDRVHRKILLITGQPGLGKTTLAHVCARQAGYETVEINASDERSRTVVNGRIRDCVGTENVRGVNTKLEKGTVRKAGKPVCVVVDEVDGVVGGSGGSGDGGFMKALIDLVLLDQKNTTNATSGTSARKGKKGDKFRLLRPMILVCNDVYHPALRPLRASNIAEIIHIRKPPLDKVVARMKSVFDKEGVDSDLDGVRRLCEATWGISSRRDDRNGTSNAGEGDIRAVMVIGEWAAGKLRATWAPSLTEPRLTRQWIEKNILTDLTSSNGSGARGIGRGGAKEAADRVFIENAGFPKSATAEVGGSARDVESKGSSSVSDVAKGRAISLLRSVVDTSGETDRIVTDVFSAYPSRPFQDDNFLSKPNAAYDWLHFHDTLSSRVHHSQEWELNPYLSTSILAFHHLFAIPKSSFGGKPNFDERANGEQEEEEEEEPVVFSGPRADFEAFEAQKQHRASLIALHSSLSLPLARIFRSPEQLATDLLPHLNRMLSPTVQPVVVGGSAQAKGTASVRRDAEKDMVRRAVQAMGATGVAFERVRVEEERAGGAGFANWIYRMEPPIDTLATFESASKAPDSTVPARYAVRQVLDQELARFKAQEVADARQARFAAGGDALDVSVARSSSAADGASKKSRNSQMAMTDKAPAGRRDFFGRLISGNVGGGRAAVGKDEVSAEKKAARTKVWVTYHEGFSNAVRKPITIAELMAGL